MTDNEKLYERLGELIYATAMADGVIQKEETSALQELLKDHPWANDIERSFNYEVKKASDPEDIYQKVISFCQHHGPSPIYAEFIAAIDKIANADGRLEESELRVKNSFSQDLVTRFQKDIDKIKSAES